jgi:hypothetical protein
MDQRWARPWFATTAGFVAAGIIIQLFVTANSPDSFGGSTLNRALNIFAFFTIQANLLVGATCLLLALRLDRSSTVFAGFRMAGLIGITVTFIVFHVALSRLLDLDTWAQTANQFQHTVVPIMTVVGWLAFGPRDLTSRRITLLTILFPLLYIIFTMIRGPLASDWYPYPFVDVQALGYLRVAINGVWIAVLFIATAAGATALDQRLSRSATTERSDGTALSG